MKRNSLFFFLLILSVSIGYAQTQVIETLETLTQHIAGGAPPIQVVGSSGITFTQGDATRPTTGTSANTINGSQALILRKNQGRLGWIEIPMNNGIEDLRLYCVRAYSSNADIQVSVAGNTYIRNAVNDTVSEWSIDSLNYPGPTTLRIELVSGGAGVIDSIIWTEPPPAPYQLTVDVTQTRWTVSHYLVGMHSVYNFENDEGLATARYDQWLRDTEISTMRYPGGTVVKYWDWENPTGVLTGDPWDPSWDTLNNEPEENWRDLDEYLTTLDSTGMVGLFGVNITSGYVYDSVQESIDRAVRMVQYVKDRGHSGAFWYLGNEGGNGGRDNEAHLYVQHAAAMKSVDSSIQCMFNHNNLSKDYLKRYLAIAGDYIDIAETHGKWPYGGDPAAYAPGTFQEWQIEMPLRDRKNRNRAWRTEADSLRKWAAEAGYPHIKIANNEYGMGKNVNFLNFNRYTSNLVVIDMLQEHFIGNWYMTCFWSTIRNGEKWSVLSKANNYRYNPMHYGFEMLARAQGGVMIGELNTGNPSVYGFMVKQDDTYLAYLLNKSSDSAQVMLNIQNEARRLSPTYHEMLRNTADGFGEVVPAAISVVDSNAFRLDLPSLTYTMVLFNEGLPLSIGPKTEETVGQIDKMALFSIYPNPANDYLWIVPQTKETVAKYKIYNLNGQLVKQGVPKSDVVSLYELNSGIYILTIFTDQGNYFQRRLSVAK